LYINNGIALLIIIPKIEKLKEKSEMFFVHLKRNIKDAKDAEKYENIKMFNSVFPVYIKDDIIVKIGMK
jgi:hypothetical protein